MRARPYSDGILYERPQQPIQLFKSHQLHPIPRHLFVERPHTHLQTSSFAQEFQRQPRTNDILSHEKSEALKFIAKILIGFGAFLFLLVQLLSCDCPIDNRTLIQGVEKHCLIQYEQYDCSNNPKSFVSRQECERLKKCLEDPEDYVRHEGGGTKIKQTTAFFQGLWARYQDSSEQLALLAILITICRLLY